MHVHILGWGVFGCSCVGARHHTFLCSWITTCGDLSTVRLKKTTLDYRENGSLAFRPATCSVQTTSPRHDFSSVQLRLRVLDTTSVLDTWLQRKWIPCHRLKKTLRGPSWPPEPRSVLLSYSASSERQAKREPWDASTWQTPVVNDGRRMPWRPNRHKSQASPPGRHQSARLRMTMSLWSVSYNSGVTSLSCSLHQLECKQSEVTTNVNTS
jgi:hypothetical protein